MAGFGGAIKLTGESSYKRALSQINQSLREVSSEMKSVSSAYDKNDKSTQAINAKSQTLTKTLELQKTKLETLKNQYNSMSSQMEKNKAKHEQLVSSYNAEKTKLDEMGRTLGKNSTEYQKQKAKVSELASEVKKSTANQDANEKSMSNLRIQMNNTQATINKTSNEFENLGKKARDAANGGFTVMRGVLANLATDAIRAVGDGLKSLGSATVDLGKQSLESYANYEQLVGGVDTLFGDASVRVQEYADDAYKTAGISANQYVEQVTAFSATLLQGLGGDTVAAADYANMAMIDMSDNANKMGTSMADIQNAYQGFAKQNYTMLDNLKLGYGGTQSEMARLINDSGVLGDSVQVTADTVKDVPFDKVIEAIHQVQTNIGVTGTTTEEAMSTIEGSTAMLKSSWQNLLTGMADGSVEFGGLVQNVVDSALAVANNIIPRVQQIIEGIAQAATQLIQTVVPQLVKMIPPILTETLPTLITAVTTVIQSVLDVLPTLTPVITSGIMQIVQSLITLLPSFVDAGLQMLTALIQGISESLPQLIAMMPTIIQQVATVLISNLPLIITAGIQLLVALINGLTEALPQLISMLPTIISTIVSTLAQHGPEILQAGVQIIQSLVSGIGSMLGDVGSAIGQVASTIGDRISELPGKMLQWGKDMINGLINGIKSMLGAVGDAIGSVASKIASFIHFSRPDEGPLHEYEQWMPDMIEGMSETLEKASPALINQTKALAKGISGSMQIEGSISGSAENAARYVDSYSYIVDAFKDALSQMHVVMDDEEMGRFVEKTVTSAIYA
jgi:phage-related protein